MELMKENIDVPVNPLYRIECIIRLVKLYFFVKKRNKRVHVYFIHRDLIPKGSMNIKDIACALIFTKDISIDAKGIQTCVPGLILAKSNILEALDANTMRSTMTFSVLINGILSIIKGDHKNNTVKPDETEESDSDAAGHKVANEPWIAGFKRFPGHLLNMDIWSTGLSSRIRLALLCRGIKTVHDLVTEITSREEMCKLRGIGDVSVREIEDFLKRNGLSFGLFSKTE
jgi:hypothetical protein